MTWSFLLILILPLNSNAIDTLENEQKTEPVTTAPLLPYLQRGLEVTTQYEEYTARLAAVHNRLRNTLGKEAPTLLPKLTKEPPRPVPFGYQMIPQLIPSKPPTTHHPHIITTSYSWPRTEQMVAAELRRLDQLEQQLESISTQPRRIQHGSFEQVVAQYLKREKNQILIDRLMKHNRFWQQAIHKNKTRFDRQTRLYDATIERQKIQETLNTAHSPDQHTTLKKRHDTLTQFIETHRDAEPSARFIVVLHPNPHLWIIQVPLYSDIQDQSFLQACKEAIEEAWQFKNQSVEFRVEVLMTAIAPQDLYRPAAHPPDGTHINLKAHVARFPKAGGVLTTGTKSTHAIPRRSIVLGPKIIGTRTLAHEFGHILGFADRYFRGYRDLGVEGYKILEAVPNLFDIMASPGNGQVLRSHFNDLLSGRTSEFTKQTP